MNCTDICDCDSNNSNINCTYMCDCDSNNSKIYCTYMCDCDSNNSNMNCTCMCDCVHRGLKSFKWSWAAPNGHGRRVQPLNIYIYIYIYINRFMTQLENIYYSTLWVKPASVLKMKRELIPPPIYIYICIYIYMCIYVCVSICELLMHIYIYI